MRLLGGGNYVCLNVFAERGVEPNDSSCVDNITKTYKHGSEDNISEINNELKHIADKLSIGNRIECMKKREAFISLKDHKENFENNPKCRLINPAKSDSGKILAKRIS